MDIITEDKLTIHAFRRFLIQKKCWEKWLHNCQFKNTSLSDLTTKITERHNRYEPNISFPNLRMVRALRHSGVTFSWSFSEEGFDFWDDIFNKFEAQIRDILFAKRNKLVIDLTSCVSELTPT